MSKWHIILGTLFAILLGVLFGGPSVNAASVFDELYTNTQTLELTNRGFSNCPLNDTDITLNWSTYITDDANWFGPINPTLLQDAKDSFLQALDTGRWGVNQLDGYVQVFWTEDDSLSLYWHSYAPDPYYNQIWAESNNASPVHLVTIHNTCLYAGGDGSNAMYTLDSYTTTSQVTISAPAVNVENFFVYTDYPNYPVGYEGEEIPDSYTIPGYTAGTGLIPLSDYTVDDLDIEIIDVTSQSEKILYKIDECMFQLPNNSSGDNFTEYMYDCDNPTTIEHTFGDGYAGYNIIHRMHSTETDLWYESTLVLDVDGSSFSGTMGLIYEDIFAKCVNDDAPYIHFKECYTAFGKIANSMSFGAIKPLEAFRYEPTSECRQLGTLGDWMNLDNKTICPQFPAEVRNVVTPFVSFGLSLGVLGAILTKSRTDFM